MLCSQSFRGAFCAADREIRSAYRTLETAPGTPKPLISCCELPGAGRTYTDSPRSSQCCWVLQIDSSGNTTLQSHLVRIEDNVFAGNLRNIGGVRGGISCSSSGELSGRMPVRPRHFLLRGWSFPPQVFVLIWTCLYKDTVCMCRE